MTSITLLVTINDRDSLVYKSLTDAFLGAYNEHLVEELVFSNYSFGSYPEPVFPRETPQFQEMQ